jgi:hypothetical protein
MDDKWFLKNIHTPTKIKPVTTGETIIIAVVDDGVRITHKDLREFIWNNPKEIPRNNIDDDGNGYVDDIHGWDVADHNNNVVPPQKRLEVFYHGTHLAGIVANIARLAYGDLATDVIRIMPVKSLSDRADKTYLKDGYRGIDYAIDAGADIIICAWGVGHISPDEARILQKAHDRGILIVASAGNFPEQREQYPAAHETVLAVTALDRKNKKVERANYGAFVDLAAPGMQISSTSAVSDTGYEIREGTSQPAAMVATAGALVKLQHPSHSMADVEACLKSSAGTIDTVRPEYSAKLGAGILNIEAAVACNLFSEPTRKKNQLVNYRGYVHFTSPQEKSATWIIKPQGIFKGLRFKTLSIEGDVGQSKINFYSNDSPDATLFESYPLSSLPGNIYIPGTTAYVTFDSDKVNEELDLLMEYSAEPINFSKLYCRGTENLDVEGTLHDGSGPNNYTMNNDCKWLITAPEGKVIHIKFTEFDTEAKTDLLYFFNGAGTHEKIMAIFSGPDIPPELTTWSNQVLIWFVTDAKMQGKGWKMEYKFQDPD